MIKYIVLHIIDNFYFLLDYLLEKIRQKRKKIYTKKKKKIRET